MKKGLNFILGEHWSLLALVEMNLIPSGPWLLIPTDPCHHVSCSLKVQIDASNFLYSLGC